MSVHQRKETGAWFVRYRDEFGRQQNKTFGKGVEAKRQAESFDFDIKSRKRARDPLFIPKADNIYFDDLAQLWIDDKKTQGMSERFLKEWANTLNKHFLSHLSCVPVKELTKDYIVGYVMKHWANRSPTTRNRYLSYLKVMFNWGIENEHIKVNPLAKWKKLKERPRQSILTRDDLVKIRAQADPHIKFAIDLAYNLGVRTGKSELLALQWKHVDWENGRILVFATKTNKWRSIPIGSEFQEQLRAARKNAETDFLVEYKGRPIKSFKKGFKSACERAGIEKGVHSYDIRHLFCSTLLHKVGDPVTVANMMGHSSTKMTLDQYGHVLDGAKKMAIEKLPSLNG